MVLEGWGVFLPTLAFGLTYAIAETMRRSAVHLHLMQLPNERSSHKAPTPSGGGVSIAVASTIAGLLLLPGSNAGFWIVIAAAASAAVMGLLDDLYELPSLLRLGVQLFLVSGLLAGAEPLPLLPTPLGELPGWMLYGIIALAGVWWINLFNFMDGIDGIATTEAIFFLSGMLALALAANLPLAANPTAIWTLALVGSSLGFLVLNWPPARIFMGDAGSNFLAVALFGGALSFLVSGWISYAAMTILAATFVADATVTLANRMIDGQRWFSAHRLHAYQKLSRYWGSHAKVTTLNGLINLLWLYPLAVAAQSNNAFSWYIAFLAYTPIIVGCVLCKAGRTAELDSSEDPA